MECTICKRGIETISSCPGAIGICGICRQNPKSLTKARKAMTKHLATHGVPVDFVWRDPQKWLAAPTLTRAQRKSRDKPLDVLAVVGTAKRNPNLRSISEMGSGIYV